MSLKDHQPLHTADGIAFRVLAVRGNLQLSYASLDARDPLQTPSIDNAIAHLRNFRRSGPWKSVFCDWQAALTRCEDFERRGATAIWILAIDMEHKSIPRDRVNAYSFASHHGLPKLQFYGYITGRKRGFPKEILIPRYIPREAVLAVIPAMGPTIRVPVHLATMGVTQDLISEAGGAECDQIWKWVDDEVYWQTGSRDAVIVQRLMRSLCLETWDLE